jgi:hypothetical protein
MDFEGLAPGQPLPGWTSGVFAQMDEAAPGGGRSAAIVNTNIPQAYYRFPMVRGIVTIEFWVRPQRGDKANCGLHIGNDFAGWVSADGVRTRTRPGDGNAVTTWSLVWKGSDGVWYEIWSEVVYGEDEAGGVSLVDLNTTNPERMDTPCTRIRESRSDIQR